MCALARSTRSSTCSTTLIPVLATLESVLCTGRVRVYTGTIYMYQYTLSLDLPVCTLY